MFLNHLKAGVTVTSQHPGKHENHQIQQKAIPNIPTQNTATNFDVSYIISYRYPHTSILTPSLASSTLSTNFSSLIYALANAGLYSTIREGVRGSRDSTVLVFVRANKRRLVEEVYYSRVKDWLYGISYTASNSKESLESISRTSLTEAEKLRNVYHLIVHPVADGGAGITPRIGEWEAVEAIFPACDSLVEARESWIRDSLALFRKVFLLDFFVSLVPVLVTVFVYLPVGAAVLGRMDRGVFDGLRRLGGVWGVDMRLGVTTNLDIFEGLLQRLDPESLKTQIIWFAIIGQLLNILNSMILPFIPSKLFSFPSKKREARLNTNAAQDDLPSEAAFLAKIRREAQLDTISSSRNIHAGMACNQFSDLSLLACVWPLTAVSFLLGDWLELRSDVLKICHEMKRPIPCRFNDFGPWRYTLFFISGVGVLVSAVLVYLFGGYRLDITHEPWDILATNIFLAVLVEESLYMVTRSWVRIILRNIESSGLSKNIHESQYLLRKRLLEESFAAGVDVDEAIKSMEKDLDSKTVNGSVNGNGGGTEAFWMTGAGGQQGALRDTIRDAVEIFEKRRMGIRKATSPYKKIAFPRATRIPTTPTFKARQ